MADFGIGEYLAIATIAATAVSAYASYQQGQAISAGYNYNSQVANAQATIDTQQAEAQARADKQQTQRQLGQISADYAASGIDPSSSGTPLAVMSDQAAQGELTRQLDLYRGKIAALGAQTGAQSDQYQAAVARQAGTLRTGTTLLTGGITAGQLMSAPGNTASPTNTTVTDISPTAFTFTR